MPTKRKKRESMKRRELTECEYLHLIGGICLDHGPGCRKSKEEKRELWEKHKETVMERYFTEHGPGFRPNAWWLFEYEPRFGPREPNERGTREQDIVYLVKHDLLEPWEKEAIPNCAYPWMREALGIPEEKT